jgi:hypothetical protein
MLDLITAITKVLEDINFGTPYSWIPYEFTECRRLEPERRPVTDLCLELKTALKVAIRGLELALRAYHCRVIFIFNTFSRQDKMPFSIQ